MWLNYQIEDKKYDRLEKAKKRLEHIDDDDNANRPIKWTKKKSKVRDDIVCRCFITRTKAIK